jgi:hypothetical protein
MRKHAILWLSVLGLLALLFASCNLGPVTIEGRIYQFVSDLNTSDRSSIYLNFSPYCTDYLAIHAGTYFDIPFPTVGADPTPYSIIVADFSNAAAVTAQLNGPALFDPPLTITCQMEQVNNDWQIRVLNLELYVSNPVVE